MSQHRIVLFDSGDTLLRPTGGGWWPKPRTTELISGAGLPAPDDERLRAALSAGEPYLARRQVMPSLNEEVATYVGFYKIVLGRLFGEFPAGLPNALAQAAVFEMDQEPFEDTVPALERLARSELRMGVISNAGPSLELRHRDLGLRGYFDPFVISAVVRCKKPGRRIYHHALEAAAVAPEDAVFVDDLAENVQTATDLGMTGYVIDRDGAARTAHDLPSVADLAELADVVDA